MGNHQNHHGLFLKLRLHHNDLFSLWLLSNSEKRQDYSESIPLEIAEAANGVGNRTKTFLDSILLETSNESRLPTSINDLSMEMVKKIVSFLDTENAVRTCVLSKSWTSHWKFMDFLHVNAWAHNSKFHRTFVDNVVNLRDSPPLVKIFYEGIVSAVFEDQSLCATLMQYAYTQKIAHVSVSFYHTDFTYSFYEFSPLLSCFSLKFLELSGFYLDDRIDSCSVSLFTTLVLEESLLYIGQRHFDPSSNFPCLKTLHNDNCLIIPAGYVPLKDGLKILGQC
ncbi:hypothetical protein LINPERPRIM_LOCUS14024 [Linum perenne]